MSKEKFKLTIEFVGKRDNTPSDIDFDVNSIEVCEIIDIILQDNNGKEVFPTHYYEFQDLVEDLASMNIDEVQIDKYGDLG